MKVAVLVLANDEVCVCGRCTRIGGDGGGGNYKSMITAIRRTWAAYTPENFKVFYNYGHREGIEFPEDSKYRKTTETYWPNDIEQIVHEKRYPFAIDDCIYSDTPEGRENLYYKSLDAFEWLLNNEEFDYIIRPSAGSYVDLKMFDEYLKNVGVKDNFYAGSIGVYNNMHNHLRNPRHPVQVRYASGGCFIASRNLIQELVTRRGFVDPVRTHYKEATIIDDVTFGKHFVNDLGVEIVSFSKYEMYSLTDVTDVVKNQMQCYFKHAINPELHYAIHQKKDLIIKDV